MTEQTKDKSKVSPVASQRRRRPSRTTLLSVLLFASFLIAFAYAALAVYQWAHTVALTLPGPRQVSSPSLALPAPALAETFDVAPAFGLQPAPSQAVDPALAPAIQQPTASQRLTFLLLGVDQRPDDPSPPRTDNMIVVTVDPDTNQVGMISLPRDLFVPIPESLYSGKINTAYTVGELNKYPGGGGALAKRTVSEFLGYPIDYYVKINFDGFVQAIDAIGGVDVVVPKTIHDEEYPTMDYGYQTFHIEAGPQHLDGETALKYVRTRHADDDFQRSRRQQQVLIAIKDKLVENRLLTPVRLLDLVRVLSTSVEHDIPATQMPGLLTLASRVEVDAIEQLVIDNRYAQIDANSRFGWILVPNREKIRPAVDQIFAGQPVTTVTAVDREALAQQQARQQAAQARQQVLYDYQAQAETLRQQLSAEGARVGVYNGTGDPLLTARAADWLQRQGYNVVEAKEADRSDYPRTALITYSDMPVAEEGLKDMFAIARDNIKAGDIGAEMALDLRLIIGRDFYLLVSN
jgi:polyisoprenyl-teichoic acid--peptidoglycan teichoic acid transferase